MPYVLSTQPDLTQVDAAAWDALVDNHEPFARHSYLTALQTSGCVGAPGCGWYPMHLLLHEDAALVAAMPLYIKTDSYGEFIFDWAWAQGAQQAGLPYYPKLVGAMPFTPASGRRILHLPDRPLSAVAPLLVEGLSALSQQVGAHSAHLLFCAEEEAAALQPLGFVRRKSFQFHWQRAPHWHTFEDFTADMRSSCRKQVRKERARAQGHGLLLTMRAVEDVPPQDIAAMYRFYRQTVWEKGAQAYLSEAFFAQLARLGTGRVLLAMAHDGDTPVAGALFFRAGNHLYGRYWGAVVQLDALHFELCYYMPIAWCLRHGITRFEAGAQGEHKLKRGFLPNVCHSAHKINHPGLHHAVSEACRAEGSAIDQHIEELAVHGPFHR